ncbi:synapse differentiation-inducing gene protein 1-like [Dysidea avara]|uniref:synapse differentiation-inducing gene protein 1-like n=1 Tax=Dysidea avara TaxID=196820 RepID=UPI003324E64B
MSNSADTGTSPPSYIHQSSTYQPVTTYGTTDQSSHLQTPVNSEPQGTHAITVLHQPVHGAKVVVGLKPDNYMAFSLISFLCCCHCIGLAALIYSLQVDSHYAAGRILEAQAASSTALKLNKAAITIGIVLYILYISASVATVIINNNNDDDNNNYDYDY